MVIRHCQTHVCPLEQGRGSRLLRGLPSSSLTPGPLLNDSLSPSSVPPPPPFLSLGFSLQEWVWVPGQEGLPGLAWESQEGSWPTLSSEDLL